ncbi:MAG: 16S rRNA (cytosine(967)-C(5))-methyltransferase RsmB [Oscillospiraceae bacterium]|nr:16S rRNA (cytosine(967)-C(5))-methyltransferase RsmB [Oscillospiraceae bacterium]
MPANRKLTGRDAAFEALVRMETAKAYSNLTLDSVLKDIPDGRERQFASALFYGVLERKITLDRIISHYVKKGAASLDAEVLTCLELGIYQLLHMDGIPDRAAVDESVELCKRSKKKSASGLVNGVLRAFLRDGKKLPEVSGRLASLSFETAMPEWILSMWEKQYGSDTAEALALSCLGRPPMQLRVNTVRITADEAEKRLTAVGVRVKRHPLLPDCLTVRDLGAVGENPLVRDGLLYVQDAASQLCARAVDPKPGERVFDLCSAPGSKSFTMAQLMEDKGEILAFDLHANRVKLITSGAARLGLTIIKGARGDAAKYNEALGLADRVLCDVPCAGLGVIRRKPEIRLKPEDDLRALPDIQKKILLNAANYVKPGGVLVYSTCSLNREENDRVVDAFLAGRKDFAPDPLPEIFRDLTDEGYKATLMPHKGDYDGFFIARMKKRIE